MAHYKNLEEKRQQRNARRRERQAVARAMEVASPESAMPYMRKRQRRKFAKRIALLGYEIVKRAVR